MRCPGQDSRYWKPGAAYDVTCPQCGSSIEFFKDESTEDGYGATSRIRLYDKVMPIEQVAALDRVPGGSPMVPRFLRPFVNAGGVNLPAEVTPGFPHRLLGSTNLIDWIGVETNVPGASPYTFTDPVGPAFPKRFYRLVTP